MAHRTVTSWFADIGLSDRSSVGGKGANLGELARAGIAVPRGFVVRTEAFEDFMRSLEARGPVRNAIAALDPDDLTAAAECTQVIRARMEECQLPAELCDAIMSAHDTLRGDQRELPVAVRSSATAEDSDDASFAGLQDTYLWVIGDEDMLRMVRRCWASLYSVESVCYRRRRRLPEDGVAMGVVVQGMVDARTAGVMFTRSPTTGDRSVVTIEGAWGLGSAVVSGEVTPDRWVVAKITGEIPVRNISDKHIQHSPRAGGGIEDVAVANELRNVPCLSDTELLALKDIALRTERHYRKPQDIEWAVDRHSGAILLLQSRPETVWSANEAKPVAKPAADPVTHVMTIFGGRR